MNLPHEVEAVKRLLHAGEVRDCLREVRDMLEQAYVPKSSRKKLATVIGEALDTIDTMLPEEWEDDNPVADNRRLLEIVRSLTDGSLEISVHPLMSEKPINVSPHSMPVGSSSPQPPTE